MAGIACCGQPVCGHGARCGDCRSFLDARRTRAVGTEPGIPVRRYGTVPPPPEPEWVIEHVEAPGPRTIAEYGGTAVLLAGVFAAVIAGSLLYLR